LSDTIGEFKYKLQTACAQEASKETDPEKKSLYESVKIAFKDVVAVFVPSAKLLNLMQKSQQGLDFTNNHEFHRLENAEPKDPARWQPLDPARTFGQYVKKFGFGSFKTVRLNVREGNDKYKTLNYRYRQFEADRVSRLSRIETLNEKEGCYGYAMYSHDGDGGSTEWRPAILSLSDTTSNDDEKQFYKVSWLITPPASADSPDGTSSKDILEEGQVLLAPFFPQMLQRYDDILSEAIPLQKKNMTATAIAAEINSRLKKEYQASEDGMDEQCPQVSVSQVKSYLKKNAAFGSGNASSNTEA